MPVPSSSTNSTRPHSQFSTMSSTLAPESPSSTPAVRRGSDACFTCQKVGHWSESCPYAECLHCEEIGHVMKNFPKKATVKRDNPGCSGFGHTRDECPQRNKDSTDSAKDQEIQKLRQWLENCRENLHTAREDLHVAREELHAVREERDICRREWIKAREEYMNGLGTKSSAVLVRT